MIPEGAAGAMAELERRKFTAEEGVRASPDGVDQIAYAA